jgi:hypothetical protein
MRSVLALVPVLALTACVTYSPQYYSVSDDNIAALKAAAPGTINVGRFTGPAAFDNMCRAAGPITPPGGIGFAEYVQRALADELKLSGVLDEKNPAVTLTGVVEHLAFSSADTVRGSWDIRLRVTSSNGRSTTVAEHHDFAPGFIGDAACKRTADAYMPTVQKLIGSLVRSPDFKALVSPR